LDADALATFARAHLGRDVVPVEDLIGGHV
jgi:hypothetical protein